MAEYTQTKHVIRYWRGSRSSYNFLKENKALDPWMRYSVVDVIDGENHIEEYFGSQRAYYRYSERDNRTKKGEPGTSTINISFE